MNQITRYWKGVLAAVTAVAVTVVQAIQAQSNDGTWTKEDTIVVVLAFLGAIAVYATPNTPPKGEPADPNMSEQG
jgi:hypothetical protein